MEREILVVDDDPQVRRELRALLEESGFAVREATNEQEAEVALQRRPTCLLLDIWLGNEPQGGLRILQHIRARGLQLPIVVISGHGTIETAVSSIKYGASDFVEKPFRSDQLLHIVRRAIEADSLRRENQELRLRAGPEKELIGESAPLRALRERVARVAVAGSRVLVTGPAGAGKEVTARQLHALSARAAEPFLAINCALMHPERIESELFGTEDTTGAYPGLLEQAHRGTLLLDEVADMPLETQGKILRTLQEQRFHRVGGVAPIEVDVRVLASSSRDLEALVQAGAFREELLYRLNIVELKVPPLSGRPEDIPALTKHFLRSAAANMGLAERHIAPETLQAMQAYSWPGNVRQLRNVIDWLLIMAPGDADEPMGTESLPPELQPGGRDSTQAASGTVLHSALLAMPLREARERFEREYLSSWLDRNDGRIARVADAVGMERSALYRKLRNLNLVSPTPALSNAEVRGDSRSGLRTGSHPNDKPTAENIVSPEGVKSREITE